MPKSFHELTERETLALAITLEEEDGRTYGDIAEALQPTSPTTAEIFRGMMKEEAEHRRKLTDLYRQRFGEHITMIRPQDVKGFVQRDSTASLKTKSLNSLRKQAAAMELQTRRFYEQAAARTTDLSVRELLNNLADEERIHEATAERLTEEHVTQATIANEDEAKRRLFIMQIIQPGLAGLMDGSVSTLAPIFAAAITSHNAAPGSSDMTAFKVGLAASIGRRHLYGVRRGALGRRLAHRPRTTPHPRHRLRPHDHRRRHRPHPPLPPPQLLHRFLGRHPRRRH